MSIDTVSPAKGPLPPPATRSAAQHATDLRDLLRAMEAMLRMKKINIAELERATAGEPTGSRS